MRVGLMSRTSPFEARKALICSCRSNPRCLFLKSLPVPQIFPPTAMAVLCGISISNLRLNKQSHSHLIGTLPSLSTLKKPIQILSSSSSSVVRWSERLRGSLARRMFNLSIFGFLSSWDLAFSRLLFYSKALASPLLDLELDRYTDSQEGFTLLVPSSWNKVDKAGAIVLFEDANNKANNVGVVVSPTRISSLGEFGTPEFVADKLIQAERRKMPFLR